MHSCYSYRTGMVELIADKKRMHASIIIIIFCLQPIKGQPPLRSRTLYGLQYNLANPNRESKIRSPTVSQLLKGHAWEIDSEKTDELDSRRAVKDFSNPLRDRVSTATQRLPLLELRALSTLY